MTGGAPYDDLVKCWEYVRDNLPFVDTDNGVAAGASYGAFMVNWIQGNPLGRKFKALVTHDGPFFGDSRFNTEELWFVQHDVCFFTIPSHSCKSIHICKRDLTNSHKKRTMARSGPTVTTTTVSTRPPPNTSSNGTPPCSSSTATTTTASLSLRASRYSTSSRSGACRVGLSIFRMNRIGMFVFSPGSLAPTCCFSSCVCWVWNMDLLMIL